MTLSFKKTRKMQKIVNPRVLTLSSIVFSSKGYFPLISEVRKCVNWGKRWYFAQLLKFATVISL